MAHRVAGEAEADLDGIWLYVATQSGDIDVANLLIDRITDRFFFSPLFLTAGARAMTISGWGREASL